MPAGGSISLVASAHDPNSGDTLSYAWSATAGAFSSPSAASTSWTAPASTGIQSITLSVTDSRGLSSSIVLAVNVTHSGREGEAELSISFNSSPRVASLSASPTQLAVGQAASVSVSASDPEGDSLSYSWSASCAGSWTHASSSAAQFTPSLLPANACNNCRLTVTVTDGRGGRNTGTVALCIRNTPPSNHLPPVIVRTYHSSDSASPGQVLTYEVVASDPEGSALSFFWQATTGSLGQASHDAFRSRVTWTAPSCVRAGTSPAITVTVINAFHLTTTRSFAVTGLPVCGPSGHWTLTGPMWNGARWSHAAVLLPSGKVLVAGGTRDTVHAAEVYDPGSNTWSFTGPMVEARALPTATLLPNGKVLVVGGYYTNGDPLTTAELYDPASGTWSVTGDMLEPLVGPAVLLPNGRVLVVGSGSSELYDPASGTWSVTGSLPQYLSDAATLLPNGKVLSVWTFLMKAELYDPASDTWSPTGDMNVSRDGGTATRLLDGRVLVVGTPFGDDEVESAELYTP